MAIKVKVKSKMKQKTDKAMDMYEENTTRHLNRIANHFRNQIICKVQQVEEHIK